MAALVMTNDERHTVSIETACDQLCNGQDYVSKGTGINVETGENFVWAMLNDGHGSNSCINFIRSVSMEKMSELIGESEPIQAIANHIDVSKAVFPSVSSGATVVITRCYKDRIECFNSGDSQFIIFKNDNLFHISKEHNSSNEEERKRVIEKGFTFAFGSSIKLLSETEIKGIISEYIVFPKDKRQLACTQALGHNSRTGYLPEKVVIPLEEGISYRIVMGSDGIFDMTMLDNPDDIQYLKSQPCKDICDKAVNRWLQDWNGHLEDGSVELVKWHKRECDDVSVIVIDVVPIKN